MIVYGLITRYGPQSVASWYFARAQIKFVSSNFLCIKHLPIIVLYKIAYVTRTRTCMYCALFTFNEVYV